MRPLVRNSFTDVAAQPTDPDRLGGDLEVHLVVVLVAVLAMGVLEYFRGRTGRQPRSATSAVAFGWAAADIAAGRFCLAFDVSKPPRAVMRFARDRGQRAVDDQSVSEKAPSNKRHSGLRPRLAGLIN